MKRKTIEKIPYLTGERYGKKGFVIATEVKQISDAPHLFVEIYENKKDSMEVPVLRVVLTQKDWGNYVPNPGVCQKQWSASKIESICEEMKIKQSVYDERRSVHISKKNTEIIRNFAKVYKVETWEWSDWEDMIDRIQRNAIRIREERQRQRRETALRERAENTPALPKTFEDWYKNVLFAGINYLYYKRRGRYADISCSCCGQSYTGITKRAESFEGQFESVMDVPRDKQVGTCRWCGKSGIYKPKGRMDGVYGMEKYCYVGQKFKEEGVVIRYISITKMLRLDEPESYAVVEIARDYFEPGKKVQKDYHWHSDYSDAEGWQDCNFGGCGNISQGKAEIYPGTFRELEGTILQYSGAKEYYQRYRRDGAALGWYMETYQEKPYLEMLVKMGLHKIADVLAKGESDKARLNSHAKRPEDLLRIYKHKLRHLIQWGGDTDLLKVLQTERKTESNWTDEECEKLATISVSMENVESALRFMTLRKFMNRVEKYAGCEWSTRAICSGATARLRTIASTYVDYLNMRNQLGYDMANTVFLFPRDLDDAHRKMTIELNKKVGDKRLQEVKAKFPEIRKQYRTLRKKYYYEDEQFVIRPAISAEEIVMEGRILHHCVGGDGYLGKHNRGESIILMLRFKEKHTIPYITVEIRENRIVQWYGAYDKKPDEENMEKWLSKYITRLKANGKDRELLVAAG